VRERVTDDDETQWTFIHVLFQRLPTP
jgi:hypothetical protein